MAIVVLATMINRKNCVRQTWLLASIFFCCGVVPTFAKPKLASVSSISSSYSASSNALTVQWSAVKNANAYQVSLVDGSGISLLTAKVRGLSKKFDVDVLADGQRYTITLRALSTSRYAASVTKKKKITFRTRVATEEYYGRLKTVNSAGRNGTLFLPKNYRLKSVPVMLLFHGSSASGKAIANAFHLLAQKNGFVIIAPDSVDVAGWQISRDLNTASLDQQHIAACLAELAALPNISISKFLVAGHSAGAIVASFYGSNDSRFSAFAVLHGGIVLSALGANNVPVWLSTGSSDSIFPPAELNLYESALKVAGTNSVTSREYATDHSIDDKESKDLVSWWLDL